MKRNLLKPALSVYAFLVYFFMFAPIIIVVYMSFNANTINVFPLKEYSLKWYRTLFQNSSIFRNFTTSVFIALVSTGLSLVLATCASYSIVRYKTRFKSVFIGLILAPMLIPAVIVGISMLLYFSFLRLPAGLFSVIIGHTILTLPYAAVIITARLQGFNIQLEEAARNLGAPERVVFFRIVMPLIMPGLVGGGMFAFTISMDEFALTFFLSNYNSQTLPIRIYSMLRFGLTPELNALSTLILCITVAVIVARQGLSKKLV